MLTVIGSVNIDLVVTAERIPNVRRPSLVNILFDKGVKQLQVTVGKRCCAWVKTDGIEIFPIYDVAVVDTTAAGDSFKRGFIDSLMAGEDMVKAIHNGNAVASLSVKKKGA